MDLQENSISGIVNPHFRRGYFKRLESDFYKNKKGQIVFVHETVVNAQAKTLESEYSRIIIETYCDKYKTDSRLPII